MHAMYVCLYVYVCIYIYVYTWMYNGICDGRYDRTYNGLVGPMKCGGMWNRRPYKRGCWNI